MKADLGEAAASTPFTPAISVVYALREGVRLVEAEGVQARFARHRSVAAAVRAGVRALGLQIIPKDEHASETVSAVWMPDGVSAKALLDMLRVEHGVVLAGGVGKFSGKVFRFGHLGWVEDGAILAGLRALEVVLPNVGGPSRRGAEAAAREILAGAPA
jgi:aspartate aminotransferase-like enzyme